MVSLKRVVGWLERVLEPRLFDDVSNNGLQIAREGEAVSKVAFAVDGSARSVRAAAEVGAQLLVVHHGISWGGGIRRLVGSEYVVVREAMKANLALYAMHLPLDANRRYGNNWEIARALGLSRIAPAFSYHGNVIGAIGFARRPNLKGVFGLDLPSGLPVERALKVGVCSGGAGEFAVEAKALGCDLYVTGEASWGDVIAAENVGMPMVCAGHYETETFGVKALARAVRRAVGVATAFVALALCLDVHAADSADSCACEELNDRFYAGASGSLVLPQGGSKMDRLGGAAVRFGCLVTESLSAEGEAAWFENRAGLALSGLWFWRGCEEYDRLFGYSRLDPFFAVGMRGWLNDGQVGPSAGVGALVYLTDRWALRADAHATFGLDASREMIYAFQLGFHYSL